MKVLYTHNMKIMVMLPLSIVPYLGHNLYKQAKCLFMTEPQKCFTISSAATQYHEMCGESNILLSAIPNLHYLFTHWMQQESYNLSS